MKEGLAIPAFLISNKKSLSISTCPPWEKIPKTPISQGVKEIYEENKPNQTFGKIQDLVEVLQTRWQVMSVWCLLPEAWWFHRLILFRKVRRTREVILKDWVGLSLRFCRKRRKKKKSGMNRNKQQRAAWTKTGTVMSHSAGDCISILVQIRCEDLKRICWWSLTLSTLIRFMKQSLSTQSGDVVLEDT